MRSFLLAICVLASTAAIAPPANAQNYPWCAHYGGDFGGSTNCGFVSREQCMATLSGIGGFCERNTQYVPRPAGSRGR